MREGSVLSAALMQKRLDALRGGYSSDLAGVP